MDLLLADARGCRRYQTELQLHCTANYALHHEEPTNYTNFGSKSDEPQESVPVTATQLIMSRVMSHNLILGRGRGCFCSHTHSREVNQNQSDQGKILSEPVRVRHHRTS